MSPEPVSTKAPAAASLRPKSAKPKTSQSSNPYKENQNGRRAPAKAAPSTSQQVPYRTATSNSQSSNPYKENQNGRITPAKAAPSTSQQVPYRTATSNSQSKPKVSPNAQLKASFNPLNSPRDLVDRKAPKMQENLDNLKAKLRAEKTVRDMEETLRRAKAEILDKDIRKTFGATPNETPRSGGPEAALATVVEAGSEPEVVLRRGARLQPQEMFQEEAMTDSADLNNSDSLDPIPLLASVDTDRVGAEILEQQPSDKVLSDPLPPEEALEGNSTDSDESDVPEEEEQKEQQAAGAEATPQNQAAAKPQKKLVAQAKRIVGDFSSADLRFDEKENLQYVKDVRKFAGVNADGKRIDAEGNLAAEGQDGAKNQYLDSKENFRQQFGFKLTGIDIGQDNPKKTRTSEQREQYEKLVKLFFRDDGKGTLTSFDKEVPVNGKKTAFQRGNQKALDDLRDKISAVKNREELDALLTPEDAATIEKSARDAERLRNSIEEQEKSLVKLKQKKVDSDAKIESSRKPDADKPEPTEEEQKMIADIAKLENDISGNKQNLSELQISRATNTFKSLLGENSAQEGAKNLPFNIVKYGVQAAIDLLGKQIENVQTPNTVGNFRIGEVRDGVFKGLKNSAAKSLSQAQKEFNENITQPLEAFRLQAKGLHDNGSINVALLNPSAKAFQSELGVKIEGCLSDDQLEALKALDQAIAETQANDGLPATEKKHGRGGQAKVRISTGGGKTYLAELIAKEYTKPITGADGLERPAPVKGVINIDLNSTKEEIAAVFGAGADIKGKLLIFDEAFFYNPEFLQKAVEAKQGASADKMEVDIADRQAVIKAMRRDLRKSGGIVAIFGASESTEKIALEEARLTNKLKNFGVERDAAAKEENDLKAQVSSLKEKIKTVDDYREGNFKGEPTTSKTDPLQRPFKDRTQDSLWSGRNDKSQFIEQVNALAAVCDAINKPELLRPIIEKQMKGADPKEVTLKLASLTQQISGHAGAMRKAIDGQPKDIVNTVNAFVDNIEKKGVLKEALEILEKSQETAEQKKIGIEKKIADSTEKLATKTNQRKRLEGRQYAAVARIGKDANKVSSGASAVDNADGIIAKLADKTMAAGDRWQYIAPQHDFENMAVADLKKIAASTGAEMMVVPFQDGGKLGCRVFNAATGEFSKKIETKDIKNSLGSGEFSVTGKKVISFFDKRNVVGGDYENASLGITRQFVDSGNSGVTSNQLMQYLGRNRSAEKEPQVEFYGWEGCEAKNLQITLKQNTDQDNRVRLLAYLNDKIEGKGVNEDNDPDKLAFYQAKKEKLTGEMAKAQEAINKRDADIAAKAAEAEAKTVAEKALAIQADALVDKALKEAQEELNQEAAASRAKEAELAAQQERQRAEEEATAAAAAAAKAAEEQLAAETARLEAEVLAQKQREEADLSAQKAQKEADLAAKKAQEEANNKLLDDLVNPLVEDTIKRATAEVESEEQKKLSEIEPQLKAVEERLQEQNGGNPLDKTPEQEQQLVENNQDDDRTRLVKVLVRCAVALDNEERLHKERMQNAGVEIEPRTNRDLLTTLEEDAIAIGKSWGVKVTPSKRVKKDEVVVEPEEPQVQASPDGQSPLPEVAPSQLQEEVGPVVEEDQPEELEQPLVVANTESPEDILEEDDDAPVTPEAVAALAIGNPALADPNVTINPEAIQADAEKTKGLLEKVLKASLDAAKIFDEMNQVLVGKDSNKDKKDKIAKLGKDSEDDVLELFGDIVSENLELKVQRELKIAAAVGDPAKAELEQEAREFTAKQDKFFEKLHEQFAAAILTPNRSQDEEAKVASMVAAQDACKGHLGDDNLDLEIKKVVETQLAKTNVNLAAKAKDELGKADEIIIKVDPAAKAVAGPDVVPDAKAAAVNPDAPTADQTSENKSGVRKPVEEFSKDTAKNIAINVGKAGVAIALAAAIPGLGFFLAIAFLIATKDYGNDKEGDEKNQSWDRMPQSAREKVIDNLSNLNPDNAERAQQKGIGGVDAEAEGVKADRPDKAYNVNDKAAAAITPPKDLAAAALLPPTALGGVVTDVAVKEGEGLGVVQDVLAKGKVDLGKVGDGPNIPVATPAIVETPVVGTPSPVVLPTPPIPTNATPAIVATDADSAEQKALKEASELVKIEGTISDGSVVSPPALGVKASASMGASQ